MATSEDNVPSAERLIPGLPDDMTFQILAMISHGYHGRLECVSKKWRDAIRSEKCWSIKAERGWCGNWIFVNTHNPSRWEAYDSEADRWSPLPNMAHPFNSITGFSCVTVCKKLLVIGGQNLTSLHQEVLSDVSLFDPYKKEWRMAANMRKGRRGFVCVAISGKVYVAGGDNETHPLGLVDAEVYDPVTDTWDDLPPMPFPLRAAFSFPRGNQLYIAGRRFNTNVQLTHVVFNTVEHQWQVLENLNPHFNFSTIDNDETLFVFDEETTNAIHPAMEENTTISWWPAKFRPDYGSLLRALGTGLIAHKRRLYWFGGVMFTFDVQSQTSHYEKFNSLHIAEATRLPLQWKEYKPMLSEGGRIVGCAILTE